jgi:large subunit ribosomal protein L21
MYAIVRTGGKQYRVREGDEILVERIDAEDGSDIALDVLLLERDGDLSIGAPTVAGATVSARVVGAARARKVVSFKYKNKTRRRQTIGHRQEQTRIAITSISAG